MNIEQYGIYLLYALIYIVCAVVLKHILNWRASAYYVSDQELFNGNIAVALRRSGAHLGLAIAMMGVLNGETADTLLQDLIATLVYGLVSVAFIFSSLLLTDRLILPGVNNLEQLKENNISVGFVEFGMLIATGIMAYSSISGDGGSILSSFIYFAVGQLSLVLLVIVYEKLLKRNFNIVDAVKEGKISSGLYLTGKLIAYALILKSAIAGNATETDVMAMATEYIILALSGMIILYFFEIVIDLLIVTSTKVSSILAEDRVVPSLQLSVAKIGMALILSNGIL